MNGEKREKLQNKNIQRMHNKGETKRGNMRTQVTQVKKIEQPFLSRESSDDVNE